MLAVAIYVLAVLYVAGGVLAWDLTLKSCVLEGVDPPRGPSLAALIVGWPFVAIALSLHRLSDVR